jgi:formylglycine-generating enzyme required for sulfatase activity
LDHEKPAKEVFLASYNISITPVTCGQYMHFLRETGSPSLAYWEFKPPYGENARHPVCFVSWDNAGDYCRWLSETSGVEYTLPTEAQWEKAARGGFWLDGDQEEKKENLVPHRWFPHGELQLSPQQANFNGYYAGTTPVGSFPQSASPYGCLDMSGNVSEWCLDKYNPDFYQSMPTSNPFADGQGLKVLKGGSWRSGIEHVRCSNRYFYRPEQSSYGIGFRVVQNSPPNFSHESIQSSTKTEDR